MSFNAAWKGLPMSRIFETLELLTVAGVLVMVAGMIVVYCVTGH